MPELRLTVNGREVRVPSGTTVAGAIARAGVSTYRRSVSEQPRGPLCGMGICQECRVTIGGQANLLSCQTPCAEDMQVTTG